LCDARHAGRVVCSRCRRDLVGLEAGAVHEQRASPRRCDHGADSAGGACAFANLPEGAIGTSTIESKTNFLGAVKSGSITATATALHRGSTTIVIETSVRDANNRLIAKVTQTQTVLRPRA
jgi:uncharacterized protein (TIGR00369 family)